MEISNNIQKLRNLLFFCLTPILTLCIVATITLVLLTQFNITNYPKTIYPNQTICINGIFPFPQYIKIQTPFTTEKQINNQIKLFNKYTIYSNNICITPTELLQENYIYKINTTYAFFSKTITLTTTSYPTIQSTQFNAEINTTDTLQYELTNTNPQIQYSIYLDTTETPCQTSDTTVSCDVTPLAMKPTQNYTLSLVQKYNNQIIKTIKTSYITILPPITIENSNIAQGQVLQDPNLTTIELTLNNPIYSNYQTSLKDQNNNDIPIQTELNDRNIQIKPQTKLTQNTQYTLTITNLHGLNGSQNETPYILNFKVDDGPTIKYTNLSNGFATNGNIVLTFNQNIETNQNLKTYISVNNSTDYTYTTNKNVVTINPNFTLDFCSTFQVNIAKNIKSTTGLISSKTYTYSPRTTCKQTYSIGQSVQGRNIYAYSFGTGSKKIVFFGSIHGSESNTQATLNYLISDLENNSSKIPTDKTVIVIPTVNPDGIANRSRFNANGVDINRNFNTPGWTAGTYLQTNYYPTGGGTEPFSEPESRIIRDFIIQQHPYLTITYHSAAGYVIPSNTTLGTTLGRQYAQLTGYQYVAPGTTDAFSYEINGTFEEWAEIQGYNDMVVELSSASSSQFTQNQKAMWTMIESN